MTCTCVWRYEQKNGATIGYCDSTCQECLDKKALEDAQIAKNAEIDEKKAFLASTDYKVIRQYEQNTLSAEDYAALLAERQAARERINTLLGIELYQTP